MPQDGAVEEQSRCSGEIEARKDLHASLEFEIWKEELFFEMFFCGLFVGVGRWRIQHESQDIC